MNSSKGMKCKKCRHTLLAAYADILQTAHGTKIDDSDKTETCETLTNDSLLHLQEEHLPQWLTKEIEQEHWTKGKLNCPTCNSRIGSFDFTAGLKCSCTKFILPPVHFIKSKVDF